MHSIEKQTLKFLVMRQQYCGLFVQSDEKTDGEICKNDLFSVSLKVHYDVHQTTEAYLRVRTVTF